MRAAVFNGPGSVSVGGPARPGHRGADRRRRPGGAGLCMRVGPVVLPGRVTPPVGSIGHEFIGVVEDVGDEVAGIAVGDLVVAPFIFSDMTCPNCQNGSTITCVRGGDFGDGVIDGGQGEAVRVPLAGSTLVPVPGQGTPRDLAGPC